ncbi:hypothetical protein [uncultured Campylobacter sp.]|uniref:hypothetical protein n=1 Tax=uncultured Campylobacter sp. TaxID=218934 RepID=UPI0026039327|nr:hypothetical protein [uncultured Campylobacter sp.]
MRFLVFIFAFLFIAAIFFVRDEILSKRAKIIATMLIVMLCAGAYLYESASERSAKLEEEMVFKFNAGARLRCGGAINFASETRGAANSSPEKYGADAKNFGAQEDEVNLSAQDKTASAAQSSTAQTNEQASAEQNYSPQTSSAVSDGQNSAQSPTLQNSAEPGQNFKSQNSTQNLDVASQNSTQQNDTQNRMPQNSASQESMRNSASQNSAHQGDMQTSDPQGSAQNFNAAEQNSMQGSAQNSKATQNFAADKEQGSAQIVTRENFTYSFSMGAFIAKKSAGAEFKGKTYKIKECVYDQ